ncbi:zinc-dependent metalloprotease [Schumannella luteola]|uniref:Putative hydrolase n=1 Tax=Schumannella luteola TaxID=472059 RepID=A0A852YP59_9MICO|nr:zinc-dependent metalloprotease [Schumannella luteola]NYG99519.1 putative hydrolase [Schumannella luteola]TPX03841.1 zinc-dependent metalloprotease [Schumannella luteola]
MSEEPRQSEPGDEEFREMLRQFLAGGGQGGDLDPAKLAAAAGLPADPELLNRLIGQLQQALQNSADGVDWNVGLEQATQLATRSSVVSTPGERSALEQALHVAALWLDEATEISSLTTAPALLSRTEWTKQTMPVWTQLAAPVADSIATALTQVLDDEGVGDAPGMEGVAQSAGRIMRNVGGTLFAMQLGQVVGRLSTEVVSGGDVGIPLLDGETTQAALVTQNVHEFGRDLDIPDDQVALYLAVRELAHARLFRHAKWLRLNLLTQIGDFSRGVRIDTERLQELAADFDPSNPEELRDAMTSGALIPPKSAEQEAALHRLETMLALIEGWVDVVTLQATARLPRADALAETMRRRRATGGPAESAFSTLVGLELRPRRLREAAAMWQAVTDAVGSAGRDALWAHPDILPGSQDIDDPSFLVTRLTGGLGEQEDDVDRALEELLGDEGGDRPTE